MKSSRHRCKCYSEESSSFLYGLRREGPSTERVVLERLLNVLSRAAVKSKNPQRLWSEEPEWWSECTDLKWKNPREHPKDKKDTLKKKIEVLETELRKRDLITPAMDQELVTWRSSKKSDLELKSDFEAVIAKASGLHYMVNQVYDKMDKTRVFGEKIAQYISEIKACLDRCSDRMGRMHERVLAREKRKEALWEHYGVSKSKQLRVSAEESLEEWSEESSPLSYESPVRHLTSPFGRVSTFPPPSHTVTRTSSLETAHQSERLFSQQTVSEPASREEPEEIHVAISDISPSVTSIITGSLLATSQSGLSTSTTGVSAGRVSLLTRPSAHLASSAAHRPMTSIVTASFSQISGPALASTGTHVSTGESEQPKSSTSRGVQRQVRISEGHGVSDTTDTLRGRFQSFPELSPAQSERRVLRGSRRRQRSKSWSGGVGRGDLPSESSHTESTYSAEEAPQAEQWQVSPALSPKEESTDLITLQMNVPQIVIGRSNSTASSVVMSEPSSTRTTQKITGSPISVHGMPDAETLEGEPTFSRSMLGDLTDIEGMPILEIITVSKPGGGEMPWGTGEDLSISDVGEDTSQSGLLHSTGVPSVLGPTSPPTGTTSTVTAEQVEATEGGSQGETTLSPLTPSGAQTESAEASASKLDSGDEDSKDSSRSESLSTAIAAYKAFL